MRRLLGRATLGLGLALLLATVAADLLGTRVLAQTTGLQKFLTITAASPTGPIRTFYSKLTFTPSTTVTLSTSSGAAIRGEVALTTGKTATDGFFYGAQGKAIIAGTVNESAAGRWTGLIGQTDTTGATLTAGQISGVWADLQGNAANAETYPLRVSNSSSVTTIPGLGLFVGRAAAAFVVSDLGNGSSGDFVVNTSGTSAGQCAQTGGLVATKALKIVADGTNYWIPLCTAN